MPEQTIKDVKKEIFLIMHKAQEMLELVEDGFTKSKLASLDQAEELALEIHKREDALTSTLASMAASNAEARAILGVPAQIEKIATAIKRILDNSRIRIKEGQLFSDKAINETGKLFTKMKDVLKKAGEAAVTGAKAAVATVVADSNTIERMTSEFATAHEDRLASGECIPKSSSTYLCLLYAFEEMAAHVKEATSRMAAK